MREMGGVGRAREWVLEGPTSSSQGVGRRTQKAVILTDFCFCLAGSRDCQEWGVGERGEGTQAGAEGKEGARTREGGRAGRRGEITRHAC